MKNWEKWEKEIREYGIHGTALMENTNKPVACSSLNCELCGFSNYDNCTRGLTNWLYEEAPKTDWSKVSVDAKVIVKLDNDFNMKYHFCKYDKESSNIYVYDDGATSWSYHTTIKYYEGICELVEE